MCDELRRSCRWHPTTAGWDGRGHPKQMPGDEIPVPPSVTSIVSYVIAGDAMDARRLICGARDITEMLRGAACSATTPRCDVACSPAHRA